MRELQRDGEVIRYLNVKEAAVAADVPYKTLYSWVRRGLIPSFQLGGKRGPYSIKESDLIRFLETGSAEEVQ
jgi:excisionase family DNA binding protein